MIIPGDQGPVQEEEGLFRMKDIDSADKLSNVADDQQPDDVAEDSEDEDSKPRKSKTEKFGREKGRLDKSGMYYKESASEDEGGESSSDESELSFIEEKDEESEGEAEEQPEDEDGVSTNPLLVDLEEGGMTRKERRAQVSSSFYEAENLIINSFDCEICFNKTDTGSRVYGDRVLIDILKDTNNDRWIGRLIAIVIDLCLVFIVFFSSMNISRICWQVWFDKDIFKGIDDDECLEEADVEAAITAIKKKGGKILEKQNGKSVKKIGETESGYTSDESDEDGKGKEGDEETSDSDSDYDIQQMNKNAKGLLLNVYSWTKAN